MCSVSAIYDQFKPYIPDPNSTRPWTYPAPAPAAPVEYASAQEIRELIAAFREAVEAAKTFDRLTHQPDCEDPEKAKLEERVAALEKKLAEMSA